MVHTEGKCNYALCLIQTLTKDFGCFLVVISLFLNLLLSSDIRRVMNAYVNIQNYLKMNLLYIDSDTYYSPSVWIHLNPAIVLALLSVLTI